MPNYVLGSTAYCKAPTLAAAVRPQKSKKNFIKKWKTEVRLNAYTKPHTCDMSYICETGRTFATTLDEHTKEVETITTTRFTREKRNYSTHAEHK